VHADYVLRVQGRLTPALKAALHPLEATDTSADTVLVARTADRAALHGFIARIEALGLELVELRRLPADGNSSHGCPACGCGRTTDEPGGIGTASRSRS
jgi:hypothetical protein